MNTRLERRDFLKAAGAGLTILRPQSVWSCQANERLNLAVVGVAGYCAAAVFMPAIHVFDNVAIAALCDVDRRKTAKMLDVWKQHAAEWPRSAKAEEQRAAPIYQQLDRKPPPLFEDFRKMLEAMDRQIDAVVVATPDHTHAVGSAAAMRAGKHVLSEKPLTITAHEARALRQIALRQKVATSLGNQGTQSGPFRRGVELIRGGTLGPVEEVHVWFSRGGANLQRPPQGTQPIPPELNWDLWLGPVAWREYHSEWIARTNWRDTSLGQLGNFGPHTANLAFMALNVAELWDRPGPPVVVEAECSGVNRLSFPVWEKIRWHVPARGTMPPVLFTWHHGREPDYAPGSREMLLERMRARKLSDADIKKRKLLNYAGAMIVGRDGAIVTDSHNTTIALLPEDKFAHVQKDLPEQLAASRGHYQDWIAACRGGPAPWSRFEHTAVFAEFLALGDVATRFPGEKLQYDPAAGRIVNHAQADAALGYEYRKEWGL